MKKNHIWVGVYPDGSYAGEVFYFSKRDAILGLRPCCKVKGEVVMRPKPIKMVPA